MCFYTTYTFKCGCIIWGNQKVAPCHESKTLQSNNNNNNNNEDSSSNNNQNCPNKTFHAFHSRNLAISCTQCNVQKRIKATIHEIKQNIERIAEKQRKREQAKKGYGVKVVSDSKYITGWRFMVEARGGGEGGGVGGSWVHGKISSLRIPGSGCFDSVVVSSPLMVEKIPMERLKNQSTRITIPEPSPTSKLGFKPELSIPKKQITTTIPKSTRPTSILPLPKSSTNTSTSISTSKVLQPPKNEGRESRIRVPVPKRGSSVQLNKTAVAVSDKKKQR